MQNAETILSIIRDRGKRGLPLQRVYPLLYNPQLYLRAYARLYSNKGAMTPGTTPETIDGMSRAKIDALIDDLRHERFRWTPVRRVQIPKKNRKRRILGLPGWTDKLLQEVLRSILEAYLEPQFSDHSHGFRPGKLSELATQGYRDAPELGIVAPLQTESQPIFHELSALPLHPDHQAAAHHRSRLCRLPLRRL